MAPADRGARRRLITALQWNDSAFPAGLYTLSHGLEGLVQDGVADAATLPAVVAGLLREAVGPVDATATLAAFAAADRGDLDGPEGLVAVDLLVSAARPGAGARRASARVGAQLLTMAAELDVGADGADGGVLAGYRARVAAGAAPGHQAPAMAVIQRALGLGAAECAAAGLAGWVNGVAGAALRLRLVDHVGAQRLIAAMAPVIEEVLDAAAERGIADIGAAAPIADIAAARHETAPARLFLS